MYRAPPKKVDLLKLTLQGVPFWAGEPLGLDMRARFDPYGELVFIAPMVTKEGLYSDQWHVTLKLKDPSHIPPPTITLVNHTVIVDIPGQRRYCRHCEGTTHVKQSCRQGQRQRQRLAQLARDQKAVKDARNADPQHQQDQLTQQPQQQLQQQQLQKQQQQLKQKEKEVIQLDDDPRVTLQPSTVPAGTPSAFDTNMDVEVQTDGEKYQQATLIVTRASEGSRDYSAEQVAAAHKYLQQVDVETARRAGANQ